MFIKGDLLHVNKNNLVGGLTSILRHTLMSLYPELVKHTDIWDTDEYDLREQAYPNTGDKRSTKVWKKKLMMSNSEELKRVVEHLLGENNAALFDPKTYCRDDYGRILEGRTDWEGGLRQPAGNGSSTFMYACYKVVRCVRAKTSLVPFRGESFPKYQTMKQLATELGEFCKVGLIWWRW